MVLFPEPMTIAVAQEVAKWRYPGPYDCYDFPDWAEMVEQGWGITRVEALPEFTALREGERVVGWYRLRPVDGALLLGCGLAPDACGHGLGKQLMGLVVEQWRRERPDLPLRLCVRPFNARALALYRSAGFVEQEARGDGFIWMERQAAGDGRMITYRIDAGAVSPSQVSGFFAGWPVPPSADTLVEVMDASFRRVWALDGDRVVGYINAISDGALTAFIPWLEVHPDYQSQGIGGELVRRIVAQLDGMYSIDLCCDEELIGYYERLGFSPLTAMGKRNPGALH